MRQAVSALYHASSALLLAAEGAAIDAVRGDARRALWARLVLDHRLYARGPLTRENPAKEKAIATLLLGERDARMAEVAPLLERTP